MRRPVAAWLFSFAGGVFLGFYMDIIPIAAAAAFVACVLFRLGYRKTTVYLLLLMLVFGTVNLKVAESRGNELAPLVGNVVEIGARVITLEEREYGYRMLVKASFWESGDEGGKLEEKLLINAGGKLQQIGNESGISLENPQSLVGKEIRFTGIVTEPDRRRNPNLFDYRLYLKTRGVGHILTGSLYQMNVVRSVSPVAENIAQLKYRFSASLDPWMGKEEKGLLLGMLFGDKSMLSDDLYDMFRRNGTAHILAVSGIHVGVVYASVSRLFRNKRGLFVSAFTMGLLLFYAALAEFSPSVVRAVVMIGIHVLSRLLHRRYDLLCCTAFSALILLLFNPYNLFHVGFQLSYLAVFSLAFLLPFVDSRIALFSRRQRHNPLSSLLKVVVKLLAPTAALQLALIPVTAYLFQYISLSAFLINIPVIALAGIIIPMGMFLLPAGLLGEEVFAFSATGAEILVSLMAALNETAGKWEYASINVVSPGMALVLFYSGLLFFLTSECFWEFRRGRNHRRAFAILLIWILLSILMYWVTGGGDPSADVVFVDVGQGDCVHIRTPSGKNILIDSGGSAEYDVGKKILLPYFLKNGVSGIDLAIVTHLHSDHYGGIASLAGHMPVAHLGLYSANRDRQEKISEETGLPTEALLYLSKGDRIQVDKQVLIEILSPPGPDSELNADLGTVFSEDDENEGSLLIRLTVKGVSILLTGDMGIPGENKVLALYEKNPMGLRADILKIGHHGSRNSTGDEFLRAVDPSIAVVQVGKNNFGHPHRSILEKLEKSGIIIYRTDHDGAILLRMNKDAVRIHTMLGVN